MRRSVGLALVLSIVTCGLYSIYWFIVLTDEVNAVTGTNDTSGVVALLLTLVTCGLYSLFWAYKMGDKLDKATGASGTRGILFLVLAIFGFGIINYCMIQDTLNKM